MARISWYKHIFYICILNACSLGVHSQAPCTNSIALSSTLNEVTVICSDTSSLVNLCMDMVNPTCTGIMGDSCGIPGLIHDRTNWLAFVPGEDSMRIQAFVLGCQNAATSGVKLTLYELIAPMEDSMSCITSHAPMRLIRRFEPQTCECIMDSTILEQVPVSSGRIHLLAVDACSEDLCQVQLLMDGIGPVINPSNVDSIQFTEQGVVIDSVCLGDSIQVTCLESTGATGYLWFGTLLDSSIQFDPVSNMVVPLDTTLNFIEVCVQPYHICGDRAAVICQTIPVRKPSNVRLSSRQFCESSVEVIDGQTIGPFDIQNPDSTFDIQSWSTSGSSECPVLQTRSIRIINENLDHPIAVQLAACPGFPARWGGSMWDAGVKDSVVTMADTSTGCPTAYKVTVDSLEANISYHPDSFYCQSGWIIYCPDATSSWTDSDLGEWQFSFQTLNSGQVIRDFGSGCLGINKSALVDVMDTIEVRITYKATPETDMTCYIGAYILIIDGNRIIELSEDGQGSQQCQCLSRLGTWDGVAPDITLCDTAEDLDMRLMYSPNGQVIFGPFKRLYVITTDSMINDQTLAMVSPYGQFSFHPDSVSIGQQYFITIVLVEVDEDGEHMWDAPCNQFLPWGAISWLDLSNQPLVLHTEATDINCTQEEIWLTTNSGYNILQHIQWARDGMLVGESDSLVINQPGLYEVSISYGSTKTCTQSAQVAITRSQELSTIDILDDVDKLTCQVEEIDLVAIASDHSPEARITWTGPGILGEDDGSNVMVNQPGIYVVRLDNPASGCSAEDEINVRIDTIPPNVRIEMTGEFDCIEAPVTLTAVSEDDSDSYTYQWSQLSISAFIEGDMTMPEVRALHHGVYGLEVVDTTTGCKIRLEQLTNLTDSAVQDLAFDVTGPTCFGDEDGGFDVITLPGVHDGYQFAFESEEFGLQTNYGGLNAGRHFITVLDQRGCDRTMGVFLPYPPNYAVSLGPDLRIEAGTNLTLKVNTDIPASVLERVEWIPLFNDVYQNQLTQTFITLPDQQIVQVALYDDRGCRYVGQVHLNVFEVPHYYVPNVIRPTSDEIDNQSLAVYADPDFIESISSFEIYDRWGSKVFERPVIIPQVNPDPSSRWYGDFRGEALSSGVYLYQMIVHYHSGAVKEVKGEINIVE